MIRSFRHKGLEAFFSEERKAGINPEHANELRRILDRLDASLDAQDMNLPGYGLHPLRGDREGDWAVKVSGNWRVTFRFEENHAVDVDYLDYH